MIQEQQNMIIQNMTNYVQNKHNQRHSQNMWNQNIWPQKKYLQNRHNARPAWTSSMFDNNLNYWCETCDKGFKTPDHLESHIKLHLKCNIDGCQFVAHPKVITKHIQMQHATGLFKKIGRLNNPEEIQKWRNERKKKYPTKANVEKKQAEIQEKEKRGERMGLNQRKKNIVNKKGFYKKGKNHASILNNKRTVNNRKRTIPEQSKEDRKATKICNVVPPVEDTRQLKPFKGIQDLLNEDKVEDNEEDIQSNLIEDEDYNNCNQTDDNPKPNVCGALTSLMDNYGSSDEDNTAENATVHNEDKKLEKNTTAITGFEILKSVKPNEKLLDTNKLFPIHSHNKNEDDSGPEESQIVKGNLELNASIPLNKNKKKMVHQKHTIRGVAKLRKKLPSTLLEKLLHNEIQHERNVILQCVRYVIKKKFFKE